MNKLKKRIPSRGSKQSLKGLSVPRMSGKEEGVAPLMCNEPGRLEYEMEMR